MNVIEGYVPFAGYQTYYRTSITRGVSVVPSAQYIINPAYDPEVSNLWLLALRLRAVW